MNTPNVKNFNKIISQDRITHLRSGDDFPSITSNEYLSGISQEPDFNVEPIDIDRVLTEFII